MSKNVVLTFKVSDMYLYDTEAKDVLNALMKVFEAFGCEVLGEISYEEIEDEQTLQA